MRRTYLCTRAMNTDISTWGGARRQMYNYILLLVAIVGFIASYMSYVEYRRQLRGESGLVCRYDEEGFSKCLVLYMLPQAKFLGKIHFSVLAPIYFTVVLALVLAFTILGAPKILLLVLLLSGLGVVLVPYLIYLEYIAKAICIWCTIMHISIVANTLMSAILYFK